MKKWTAVRLGGLIIATVVVIFGSVNNIWRTIKLGWKGLDKN